MWKTSGGLSFDRRAALIGMGSLITSVICGPTFGVGKQRADFLLTTAGKIYQSPTVLCYPCGTKVRIVSYGSNGIWVESCRATSCIFRDTQRFVLVTWNSNTKAWMESAAYTYVTPSWSCMKT